MKRIYSLLIFSRELSISLYFCVNRNCCSSLKSSKVFSLTIPSLFVYLLFQRIFSFIFAVIEVGLIFLFSAVNFKLTSVILFDCFCQQLMWFLQVLHDNIRQFRGIFHSIFLGLIFYLYTDFILVFVCFIYLLTRFR